MSCGLEVAERAWEEHKALGVWWRRWSRAMFRWGGDLWHGVTFLQRPEEVKEGAVQMSEGIGR